MKAIVKKCPKCGSSVPATEKFCRFCGYQFPVSAQSSNQDIFSKMRSSFEQGKERGQAFGNFVMGTSHKQSKTVCSKCGSENNPGQSFCKYCGNPLNAANIQSNAPAKDNPLPNKCPQCGRFIKSGSHFCEGCGKNVTPARNTAYDVMPEPSERVCPACGNPIKPGQSFCTVCGKRVEDTTSAPAAKPVEIPVQPAKANPGVTCPACGNPIKPGHSFCTVCGKRVDEATSAPVAKPVETPVQPTKAEPVVTCPACGNPIKPGHSFCTVCGKRIEAKTENIQPEPVVTRQSNSLSSNERTCPNCGAPVKPGHAFCTSCGKPVETEKVDIPIPSFDSYVEPKKKPEPIVLTLPETLKETSIEPQPLKQEQIVTCPACGNPIKPGHSFCTACGKRIDDLPSASVTKPVEAQKEDVPIPSFDSYVEPKKKPEPIVLTLPETLKETSIEPQPLKQEQIITCPSCGSPIKPGYSFCTVCGKRIDDLPSASATKPVETQTDDVPIPSFESYVEPKKKPEPIVLVMPETHKEPVSIPQPVAQTKQTRTCPYCGSPMKEDHLFCLMCGKRVEPTETPAQPEPVQQGISLSIVPPIEVKKEEISPISLVLPEDLPAKEEPAKEEISLAIAPAFEEKKEEQASISLVLPDKVPNEETDLPVEEQVVEIETPVEPEPVLPVVEEPEVPEEEEAFSTCPYCGTELLPGALFCPECGKRVTEMEETPLPKASASFKICPGCQREIDIDSVFCKYCGTRCEEEKKKKPTILPQEKKPEPATEAAPVVIEEETSDPDVETKHRLTVPLDGSEVVAPCGAKITLGGRNAAVVRELSVSKHVPDKASITDGERTRYDIDAPGVHELDDYFTINLPYEPTANHSVFAQYFNETTKEWELIDHDVDQGKHEVIIHTNHLSGFAVVDVSNSNETNVRLASMAKMYLTDDAAWNELKGRMAEEKTEFKQDPVAMAFFYHLMSGAIDLESYHFISQSDVDKAINATFGNLSNFNDVMGWIASFAYDIACYKEIIPQAVLEFSASGSEIYLPGKLIEIGANFATWLSAASIAETAYRETVENGKVSEGTIWDMYKWLNSYSFGYIIGKLGTSFGSLYALPVLLVDYSLTKIRSNVQDAENDALSKALYYFYQTECNRPMLKKQERVKVSPISGFPLTGKEAGVEVESWQTRLSKIYKANAAHHNGDPASLASTINIALYHDMVTACQKLIELANKGQGDMEIAIAGGVHNAEMRNLWSTVKEIKPKNQEEIVAKAIALLEKDMQPAFEAVAEEQRLELRRQATEWANKMNTTLNYTHTLMIDEFIPEGEKSKYAGHKVIFTRSDKKNTEDEKITPITVQWQGTLDSNGCLSFTFNTFGYMKAGAPNRIEIYAPDADPKHSNPLEKADFEVNKKVTRITIGGVEIVDIHLAEIFLSRYNKKERSTRFDSGYSSKNIQIRRTKSWVEVDLPAIDDIGNTITPMRFLLDTSEAIPLTRNSVENLPNDHYLFGNNFLTYPDLITTKHSNESRTESYLTNIHKFCRFEKGFAPFFESGKIYSEATKSTVDYVNIYLTLEEQCEDEDQKPETYILEVRLIGQPIGHTK